MRLSRLAAVIVAAACLVPSAAAAGTPTTTSPLVPSIKPALRAKPTRSESSAVARFLAAGKVHDWVGRYPRSSLVTDGRFDAATRAWTVNVWSGPAGEIATGTVADLSGKVTSAWTGPGSEALISR